MSDKKYLDQILAEMESVGKDWKELLSGEFHLKEVFNLFASLVKAAESIVTAPKSGEAKHKLVGEAFAYFDKKYRIIDRIDDLIPLPFFLEPFDGPFLRKLVDFLIGQAVAVFNTTIWAETPAN
ncbi:MAG: hypothetical protein P9M15_06135 [Candidatus Electryoneaceae bacterium]|nr:hypothetical protein [Candidatus Electryoneaceae bacterium]